MNGVVWTRLVRQGSGNTKLVSHSHLSTYSIVPFATVIYQVHLFASCSTALLKYNHLGAIAQDEVCLGPKFSYEAVYVCICASLSMPSCGLVPMLLITFSLT